MTASIPRITMRASAAALAVALAFAATPAAAARAAPAEMDRASFALIAKITVKPGQVDRFVEAMKAQVEASRREPGVVDFRALASASEPLVFYTFESYRDKAAFEAHARAPNTIRLLNILKDVQAKDLEAQFLQPLP
jgi:quinol monooxygenase YgiN